jgi:uncharacterized membrane protein YeaQ/YmgE (transglycosylase-associated protein family)
MHITLKTIDIGAVLQPGNLIAWLLVGLIAGFIGSLLVRGRGYGCIGNITVGLIGSLIGAILASALNIGSLDFWGSILVSAIGAAILVAVLQFFSGSRR